MSANYLSSIVVDTGDTAEIKTDPRSQFSWFFIFYILRILYTRRRDNNYYISIYLVMNASEKKRKGGGVEWDRARWGQLWFSTVVTVGLSEMVIF